MFKFLDRGQKGYISYNDFCQLSEEKRRNLDRIDNNQAIERKESNKKDKDWIQLYLEDADFVDLENMNKRVHRNGKNGKLSTTLTQELNNLKSN